VVDYFFSISVSFLWRFFLFPFLNKFVEKQGDPSLKHPSQARDASTQDDTVMCVVKWGKEAARFAVYSFPENLLLAKRAASFPPCRSL
jgi:hypothetical protein